MPAFDYIVEHPKDKPITLISVACDTFDKWLEKQDKDTQNWIKSNDFKPVGGASIALPGKKGKIEQILVSISQDNMMWDFAALPAKLPKALYKIKGRHKADEANAAVLGWALGTYSFDWYKEATKEFASLVLPKTADKQTVQALAEGIELTRDLINLPAADMGPVELAQAAEDLADEHEAACELIIDDGLMDENLPAIYAVGKGAASDRRPRLIDLTWGSDKHPKITLVGKGVCFDTGGLDIKPAQFMKLMKKDMGGAAHVLGLAKAIMAAKLPVRLRVLIPAVENAVSDKAMRPLDVVDSRQGKTIEIGHTDAEGRVVLADALTLASEEKPDFIIDFATLTGAARVALGTELPALFSNNDDLANDLLMAGQSQGDNMWRLPLWKPYRKMIDGKTGDISNESAAPYGGAITAALFLEEFVLNSTPWAHLDVMGWNTSSKAGRPEGGEAMALRAAFAMIKKRL
ncbi:Leucyl aminopeptidase [Candidatus Terasakiella magnetica]|uniref:Leucyl aminopeptidase n=1 Tax=Candidatus Terasakiella magnetica TaxID=1867952 RepID=A0A1C3RE11_9PROT|nr:leucyl aminopeptidase family protein [Candidatus Terasakiella magnetica]SCA55454.1 Leucyl aminopeptidase [Candidatus Terasakiella magnetica]